MSISTLVDEKNELDKEKEETNTFLDVALRPSRWDDYIGQKIIKENLKILLGAASERGHVPEHILFYGPPGLGKTTLAYLIAKELSSQIKVTSGPAIEKVADLASVLTNLASGDILFIDEIHRLNKTVEEILYPAMESGSLDILIGKGPSARTVQLPLPPFTLIGATTRIASLSSPLRSRFSGGIFRLEFYTTEEIAEIVKRSAKTLGVTLAANAATTIAERSRFTPRTANHLLKRIRDYAQMQRKDIDDSMVVEALTLLGIDAIGLNPSDRAVLETIIKKYNGGPVGLETIAASLSEEEATIEEFNEPYLMQIGMIERTPRGRVAAPSAYQHLNLKKSQSNLEL